MQPRWVSLLMTAILVMAGWGATARRGTPPADLPALAARAIADLAEREGVAPERIRVSEVQARTLGAEHLASCVAGLATRQPARRAPVPGYRIALVANNALYEYDGSRDCIVMAPRESRPPLLPAGRVDRRWATRSWVPEAGGRQAVATLRTSSQVASLEPLPIAGVASEAVRPGGSWPFARSVPREVEPPAGADLLGATDPIAQPARAGALPPHAVRMAPCAAGIDIQQGEAARAWCAAVRDSFYRLHLVARGAAGDGAFVSAMGSADRAR